MATRNYYVASGITGNVADPVTGEIEICGPDTADEIAGSDAPGTTGAEADPFLTLDGGLQFVTIDDDDLVYLNFCGRLRTLDASPYGLLFDDALPVPLGLNNKARYVIRQWEGKSPACIRGDNFPGGNRAQNINVGAGDWTPLGAGYVMTCDGSNGSLGVAKADLRAASGVTGLATVVYDWDKGDSTNSGTGLGSTGNIDSVGRRLSHLAPAASAAAALAAGTTTQGAWFLDSTTGVLSVGLPGAATPENCTCNGIMTVVLQKSGISFQSTGTVNINASPTVYGTNRSHRMRFQLFSDAAATAPQGSGINILYSTNAYMQDLLFEDSGDHAYAFGGSVVNAVTNRCDCIGYAAGSYLAVWNDSSGGSATGSCDNFRWYTNQLLGHNGLRTQTNTGSIGIYIHGPHTKITVNNGEMIQHVPASGAADNFAPIDSVDGTAPAAGVAASSYPIVVRNLIWRFGRLINNQTLVGSYIGFINCDLTSSQLTGSFMFSRAGITGRWRFEGGEIVGTLANGDGATNNAIFGLGVAFTVELYQCSVYDTATHSNSAGKNYGIFFFPAQPTTGRGVFASGCVFAFKSAAGSNVSTRVTIGDGAFSTNTADGLPIHNFTDNMYSLCGYTNSVAADVWSANASFDSAAEWAALDTGTINLLTVNPFTDTTGASLALTQAARAYRKFLSQHTGATIEGARYNGFYGANGIPPATSIIRNRPRRGRRRPTIPRR